MLSSVSFNDRSIKIIGSGTARAHVQSAADHGYLNRAGISLAAWASAGAVSVALWVSLAGIVSAYAA